MPDMKYHTQFLEDYLDALEAKQRLKNGKFVAWDEAIKEIESHHGFKI